MLLSLLTKGYLLGCVLTMSAGSEGQLYFREGHCTQQLKIGFLLLELIYKRKFNPAGGLFLSLIHFLPYLIHTCPNAVSNYPFIHNHRNLCATDIILSFTCFPIFLNKIYFVLENSISSLLLASEPKKGDELYPVLGQNGMQKPKGGCLKISCDFTFPIMPRI